MAAIIFLAVLFTGLTIMTANLSEPKEHRKRKTYCDCAACSAMRRWRR